MDVAAQSRPEEKSTFTVLVTGANSGLGFSTCCRIIDEFLFTRPQSQTLHLLFSTRDARKGNDTAQRLHAHLQRTLRQANGRTKGISLLLEARVKIENVLVDLLRLASIKALATQLLQRGQPLDALVCNAGVAGWLGVNWPMAVPLVLFDMLHATTFPHYMFCDVGAKARPQNLPPPPSGAATTTTTTTAESEPVLGEVFTANVFGHYLLTHWLHPLLGPRARIVWTSSISAVADTFDASDPQGLRSSRAYEASKRLTDYLVLTSELASTQASVAEFLPPASKGLARAKMFVTHPGVVGTSISNLPWLLDLAMVAVFYLARWLGSPWHLVAPYKGAVAATWAVLAPVEQLEAREEREGKGKWGSAIGVFGDERVARTEVEGWGYGGTVGVVPQGSVTGKTGRYRQRVETTRERREEFEVVGRRLWQEMEELRKEWEARLGEADVEVEKSLDV